MISNLLAELEQPCRICREDRLVLTGRSPSGEAVTLRLGPDLDKKDKRRMPAKKSEKKACVCFRDKRLSHVLRASETRG